jgi:hypothetical protein
VIELRCPNCGKAFPVLPPPLGGPGHCGCGLDFDVAVRGATVTVRWTHDPKYPQSGTEDYTETWSMAPS